MKIGGRLFLRPNCASVSWKLHKVLPNMLLNKQHLKDEVSKLVHPIRYICENQKTVSKSKLENALAEVEERIEARLATSVCQFTMDLITSRNISAFG